MGVWVKPLGDNSSLQCVDGAAPVDCYGLVSPVYDETNTVITLSLSSTFRKSTRVDRGVEYAANHYENLLRRLAD